MDRQPHPYGGQHKKLRAAWEQYVVTGQVRCARCDELIILQLGDRWELGHDDKEAGTYNGPEHRECNRRARPAYDFVERNRVKYATVATSQTVTLSIPLEDL